MSTETRLNELLSVWQQLRRQGKDVEAAQLCRDCPALRPDQGDHHNHKG